MRPALPLGLVAFWGGLAEAARGYPGEYDWRYMTISSLLYPERNPHGYRWAWAGIAACGAGGLTWIWLTDGARRHSPAAGAGEAAGRRVLGFGYLCMVCCALLPPHLLHIARSHDALALAAFVCVCIGTMRLTYLAAAARDWAAPRAAALAAAAMLPIALAALTQLYISYAWPHLPWVGLSWRDRGVPAYLSFAFWEWASCAVFTVYTLALWLLREA